MTKQQYGDRLGKMVSDEGIMATPRDFDKEYNNILIEARNDKQLSTQDYLDLIEDMIELTQRTCFAQSNIIDSYNDKMLACLKAQQQGKITFQELDDQFIKCLDELRQNKLVDDSTLNSFIEEGIDGDRLGHMTL